MKVNWSERAALELAETAPYVAREFGQKAAVGMRDLFMTLKDSLQ